MSSKQSSKVRQQTVCYCCFFTPKYVVVLLISVFGCRERCWVWIVWWLLSLCRWQGCVRVYAHWSRKVSLLSVACNAGRGHHSGHFPADRLNPGQFFSSIDTSSSLWSGVCKPVEDTGRSLIPPNGSLVKEKENNSPTLKTYSVNQFKLLRLYIYDRGAPRTIRSSDRLRGLVFSNFSPECTDFIND